MCRTEDGEWGQFKKAGGHTVAFGNICLACSDDSVEYNPGQSLEDFTNGYTADTDGSVADFASFQKNKKEFVDDPDKLPDHRQSECGTVIRTIVRVTRAARFCDEAEARRITKMSPQSIGGIPGFKFPDEDGVDRDMVVFPDDGSDRANRLRLCEVISEIEVYNNSVDLAKSRCFLPKQADFHFKALQSEQLNKRPAVLRAGSSTDAWEPGDKFISIDAAIAKAHAIIEKKKHAAAAKVAGATAPVVEAEDDTEEEETIVMSGARKRGLSQAGPSVKVAKTKASAKAANKKPATAKALITPKKKMTPADESGPSSSEGERGEGGSADGDMSDDGSNASDDSHGTKRSRGSPRDKVTRQRDRSSSCPASNALMTKDEETMLKWTKKLDPKKIQVHGNLGRSINQAIWYCKLWGLFSIELFRNVVRFASEPAQLTYHRIVDYTCSVYTPTICKCK